MRLYGAIGPRVDGDYFAQGKQLLLHNNLITILKYP